MSAFTKSRTSLNRRLFVHQSAMTDLSSKKPERSSDQTELSNRRKFKLQACSICATRNSCFSLLFCLCYQSFQVAIGGKFVSELFTAAEDPIKC